MNDLVHRTNGKDADTVYLELRQQDHLQVRNQKEENFWTEAFIACIKRDVTIYDSGKFADLALKKFREIFRNPAESSSKGNND